MSRFAILIMATVTMVMVMMVMVTMVMVMVMAIVFSATAAHLAPGKPLQIPSCQDSSVNKKAI